MRGKMGEVEHRSRGEKVDARGIRVGLVAWEKRNAKG